MARLRPSERRSTVEVIVSCVDELIEKIKNEAHVI